MGERQFFGVQCLPRERGRFAGATVHGIADNGMSDGLKMYAYLVRAPGLKAAA